MTEHALRVLIVDDEESVRKPLAKRLHSLYNYQVDTAADSGKALHLISEAQGRYDVAVIDQILEDGISGSDLLRNIKERYPEIQVIIFTGWGLKENEGIRILRQGAYRYIAKGNYDELALTIRFAAEQRQLRREREYLSALVQVSHELTQTTDIERQLELVWEFVQERLATATFFISLYDSKKDTLKFPLSFDEGEPEPLPDRHLGNNTTNWGLAGHVVKNNQEQVWYNLEQAEQKWQTFRINPKISKRGPSETGICLPLQVRGGVLGVLSVQSYQSQAFDQAFLNAVRTLGSHLAPAIENAYLFQEITQSKNEVETTRDHLDRLVASSFDGIITTDICGNVTEFNAMAEEILGYKAKEVLGKPVRDFYYDPEEPGRIGKLLWQSTDGKLPDYETGVKNKSGDRIPINLSAIWLFDRQGNRIGSAGYFRDLRHIRETEMHRQQLLDASNAISQASSLKEGLQSLSRIMVESCIATFCSILLLAPEGESLVVGAAYPFPRSERLVWDPGIDNVCTPFREPGAAKMMMSDKPIVLRKGRRCANKVLKHLAEEIKLIKPLHSILIVPLQADENRLGICVLGEMRTWDRSPISDRKIELAQSLANQAAIFIEKMKVHQLTEQRAELLEALQNLSLTISASLDFGEILNKTCQAAVELFDVDHSGLVLFDPDCVKGKVGAEYPATINTVGIEIPLKGVPIEEKLIKDREPIIVFDIENEERLGQVREIMYDQFNIHSTVFMPVISKGELLGSFSLDAIGQKRRFANEEIELCKIFAAHVASAIENAHLHHETKQRSQLLETLEEASRHIRAEKEPTKLLQEIVRLAAELLRCTASGLFINHSHLGELELTATYGLPEDILGCQISHRDGLIGSVAKSGETQIIHDYARWTDRENIFESFNFNEVVGIPLKHVGEVVAVLFVADTTGRRYCEKGDLEILERFAAQASIALHTSQLMDNEQRGLSQLAILHRISGYIQQAKELDKILHVVLTGITAGYGLGYNRAALFLQNKKREGLVGRVGIGWLKDDRAREDWKMHHKRRMEDFENYLKALEKNEIPRTPLDERIHGLILQLSVDGCDAFTKIMQEQQPVRISRDEISLLPKEFIQAFEPAAPLVGVPLIAREKVLGLLIADNKFTRSPITANDVDLLLTFANTAAVAIDNMHLFQEAETAREKIRTSFEASNALVLSQASKQLLENIIHQTQLAAGASWVSIVLVDEMGRARNLFTTGADKKVDISNVIRSTGITMKVMHSGKAVAITDIQSQRDQVNPRMFRNKVGAALCLPFSVQGKQVGAMWIHYDEPRCFPTYEVEAIQLYVNQAAIAYDSSRRMEELEHMRQVAEVLSGVAGLDEVLRWIAKSANELLGADSVAIRSFDVLRGEFIPEGSIEMNIPKRLWEKFRKEEPRKEGTAYTIMQQGWIGVADVADVERYPYLGGRTKDLLTEIGAHSFQGVALTVGDEKLGVLYLNYKYQRSFSEEEQKIARTFANHAALALKKNRLLEELDRALKQVTLAHNTARIVAEVTVLEDLNETLNSIVKGTQSTLGCDVVTLYTYNEERDEFGFPPAMVGVKNEAKVREFGSVARDSVPYELIKLDDIYVAEDSPSDPMMGSSFSSREGIRSTIGVPLITRDRKVGVLFVNYRSRHCFTKEERENVKLYAHQAAVAINNAQLYEAEQCQRREAETLREVARALSTTLDSEVIFDLIFSELKKVVPFDSASLQVLTDGGLKIISVHGSPDTQRALNEVWSLNDKIPNTIVISSVEPRIVDNPQSTYDIFKLPQHSRILCWLGVPLLIGDRVIGMLTLDKNESHFYTDAHARLAMVFASQAALAIENAHLYEQEQIIAAISREGVQSLDLETFLNTIFSHVKQVFEKRRIHVWTSLATYDKDTNSLLSHPTRFYPERIKPDIISIDTQGIMPWAAKLWIEEKNLIYYAPDVSKDPHYLPLLPDTCSEIAVPISFGGELLGVFDLESSTGSAFNPWDKTLLQVLADQMATMIQNVRQYEEVKRTYNELKQTKGLVSARTTLAWMGMAANHWRHIIEGHAINIRNIVTLLQQELVRTSENKVLPESIEEKLARIKKLATKIEEKPITPPLSSEEGVFYVNVNSLVQERMRQLWQNEPYKLVRKLVETQVKDSTVVWVSSEWLRRALDILIDNAVEELKNVPHSHRLITVITRLANSGIEIVVSDTGRGIPDAIKKQLFQKRIEKPGQSKGLGMGLLIAQAIAETYGGSISCADTSQDGTTMVIWLPIKTE